jgi:hypothetical protein
MKHAIRTMLAGCIAAALSSAAHAQQAKTPAQENKPAVAAKAQDKPAAAPGGQEMSPEQKAMMEQMEKMRAVGENHKLLEYMIGDWNYTMQCWMDPSAPPMSCAGTTSTRAIMGGRYYVSEHKGTFMGEPFEGIATTAYDNSKQKFVGTWMDNFSTGIMMSEGTYDPKTKSFTFTAEVDDCMNPGKKVKMREVIRVIDDNKHVMEFYKLGDGKEIKEMEITCTRKK